MKLVAIRCPVCARPMKAEVEDLIVACGNCRTPVSLDERGLQPVKVVYATPQTGAAPESWLPLWIFQGEVTIQSRESQGRGDNEWQRFWSEPRYFYIPAWSLSLETLNRFSIPLVRQQPRYQPLTGGPPGEQAHRSVTVSAADAEKLLEFLVLEIEVQRKDWLRTIAFQITASKPVLWALPVERGERIVALEARK